MEKITLELETITPLFIAGADPGNIQNEGLRPQSLRGLMRWWFRAAMGGVMWDRGKYDLKQLLTQLSMYETNIFGSNSKKSSVTVIFHNPDKIANNIKEFDASNYSSQIRYFFFSMKGTKTSAPRKYIKEGTELKVSLIGDKELLKSALASLWLMVNLGGIGSRSRRFGGQIKVKNVSFGLEEKQIVAFTSEKGESYEDFLRNNIRNIQDYLSKFLDDYPLSASAPNVPPFSMIARNHFSLLIKKHEKAIDWKGVVKDFGNVWVGNTKTFEEGIRREFIDKQLTKQIKDAIFHNAGKISPQECNESRPFMGLPLNYFFKDLQHQLKAELTAYGKQAEYFRRASPILFGLTKYNDFLYSRVIIFKSAFLSEWPVSWKISKLNWSVRPKSDMGEILSKVESELKKKGWKNVDVM